MKRMNPKTAQLRKRVKAVQGKAKFAGILYLLGTIALGALAFTRGEKGWMKGGGVGLLFTALSYLAFSAIGGDFSLSWMIVLEVVIAFIIGVLAGSLAVNLKR